MITTSKDVNYEKKWRTEFEGRIKSSVQELLLKSPYFAYPFRGDRIGEVDFEYEEWFSNELAVNLIKSLIIDFLQEKDDIKRFNCPNILIESITYKENKAKVKFTYTKK